MSFHKVGKPASSRSSSHPGKRKIVRNPPPQPAQLGTDDFPNRSPKAHVNTSSESVSS